VVAPATRAGVDLRIELADPAHHQPGADLMAGTGQGSVTVSRTRMSRNPKAPTGRPEGREEHGEAVTAEQRGEGEAPARSLSEMVVIRCSQVVGGGCVLMRFPPLLTTAGNDERV